VGIALIFFLEVRMSDEQKKRIRFINTDNKTLFYLDDGEEIEIDTGDVKVRYVCRYIGEYHLWVGNQVYHIREFAELREKLNQRYYPVKHA
jgi:hypothetical protein